MEYYDKNDNQIKDGMTLIHDEKNINDGSDYTEKVFACGDDDLGFDGTNHNWSLGVAPQVYYPLSGFDLSEWTIMDEKTPTDASERK
jgi:hypothetical protein